MTDIRKGKLSDLTPDKRNANKGTKRGLGALDHSLRQYGAGRSILIDKNGNIIAGNKTVERAADIGLDDVIIVQTDGKQIVAVQRTDLDLEHDMAARELAYADNRVAQIDLEWEPAEIQFDIANGIDLSQMFSEKELIELGVTQEEPKADPGAQVDKAEELREKWRVEPGQLWQLGEHRLICGDCTDKAVVDRLMGGEKADMVFTDPPYNVAGESRNYAADTSKAMSDLKDAEWDQDFDIASLFPILESVMAKDCAVYVCTSQWLVQKIWEWMWCWSDFCSYNVWCKPNPMPSLSKRHWTWATELIAYAVRGKHISNFPAEGHALNWWNIPKSKDTDHPTEKALEVPKRAIEFSSNRGQKVFDGFLGSGTTLIACEQLGRACRAVERDPKWIAISLQRWVDMTGGTPELITGY